MKKIREALNLDDRTAMLLSVITVGVLLIAAMLVPLAFRSTESGTVSRTADAAAKTALFAAYWNKGPEEAGVQAAKPETLSPELTEACEARMHSLIEMCIDDQAIEQTEPTGREYTVLHGSDGIEVQVCRMWLEAKGDWQNWLDVCFDSETGMLYYLYLSRECLSNQKQYEPVSADAQKVAELLAQDCGWTLRYLSGNGSGSSIAVFSHEGGTLCYEIDCRLYDGLTDVRLCCK